MLGFNISHGFSKKVVVLLVILCFYLTAHNIFNPSKKERGRGVSCYKWKGNTLPELKSNETKFGHNIYFHETSCPKSYDYVPLKPRQACSVESAIRAHPKKDVFLLIPTPVETSFPIKNVLIQKLETYSNFKLRHVNFFKYILGTPLSEKINESNFEILNHGWYPVSHSSDLLRYATLFKFGGIYLDLDVIVLKPLTHLKNFVGAATYNTLGAAVIGINDDDVGRNISRACAEDLASNFDGHIWGNNGPGTIMRVLEKRCSLNINVSATVSCKGFHVHPIHYFYGLPFQDKEIFFEEGNLERSKALLSNSYTVHLWNKVTFTFEMKKNPTVPFLFYARKYCPRIYEVVNGNFNRKKVKAFFSIH